MFKVLIVLVVGAVLLGGGVKYARDHVVSAIHDAVDPGLPEHVGAHAWAPVSHGKALAHDRVRFDNGDVVTIRCHANLGTFVVHIDHSFGFQPSTTPVKVGCPGRVLQKSLADASRVSIEAHGVREHLTFTDDQDHVVARLEGRVR